MSSRFSPPIFSWTLSHQAFPPSLHQNDSCPCQHYLLNVKSNDRFSILLVFDPMVAFDTADHLLWNTFFTWLPERHTSLVLLRLHWQLLLSLLLKISLICLTLRLSGNSTWNSPKPKWLNFLISSSPPVFFLHSSRCSGRARSLPELPLFFRTPHPIYQQYCAQHLSKFRIWLLFTISSAVTFIQVSMLKTIPGFLHCSQWKPKSLEWSVRFHLRHLLPCYLSDLNSYHSSPWWLRSSHMPSLLFLRHAKITPNRHWLFFLTRMFFPHRATGLLTCFLQISANDTLTEIFLWPPYLKIATLCMPPLHFTLLCFSP